MVSAGHGPSFNVPEGMKLAACIGIAWVRPRGMTSRFVVLLFRVVRLAQRALASQPRHWGWLLSGLPPAMLAYLAMVVTGGPHNMHVTAARLDSSAGDSTWVCKPVNWFTNPQPCSVCLKQQRRVSDSACASAGVVCATSGRSQCAGRGCRRSGGLVAFLWYALS